MLHPNFLASTPSTGGFTWPAGRLPRFSTGLVAVLVVALFAWTIAANWWEDRIAWPAEGSLLIDSRDGTVYRFEAGEKRAIVNTETMRCLRRPGQHFIRYRALDDLPTGPAIENREDCPMPYPAGILVKPIDGDDIYLSTGVSHRHVPNPRTLACQTSFRPIEVVARSHIDLVPQGPPLADGENCP